MALADDRYAYFQTVVSTDGALNDLERAWYSMAATGTVVYNNVQVNGTFTSQGIDDNADATAITITSAEDVGIGETTPLGQLHVKSGDAGAITPDGSIDELIIESAGAGGISVFTPDASTGSLAFGSPSDGNGANVQWNHDSDSMVIGTRKAGASIRFDTGNGSQKAALTDSGLGLGSQTSPAYELDIQRTSGNYYGRWSLSTGQPGFLYSDAGGAGFTFGQAALLSNRGSIYASTNSFVFYQGSSGSATFTWKDNADSELMSLDSAGDLSVTGTVVTSTIELGSGGPTINVGSGTPEGVVTADVGSTFHRTDGGAGTSFYVKESGTGNTGWVGK